MKIRNKPSTEGVHISYLFTHNTVYVEAICNETGWYRIQYGRNIGYVNSKYLTEDNLHVYTDTVEKEPTCTEPGVLKHTCGCGHSYEDPIEPRHTEVAGGAADAHTKCGVCGVPMSVEHAFTDAVTVPPGCDTVGTMTHTCSCGYVYTTEIPPAHTEAVGGLVDAHSVCGVCGVVLSTEHVYTDSVTIASGCDTAGTMTHTCSCGYSYTSEIPPAHTEEFVGTADVHSKCGACGVVVSTEHTYTDEVIIEATATEPGEVKHICACGYSYTEPIPATRTEEVPGEGDSSSSEEPSTPSEGSGDSSEESSTPSEDPSSEPIDSETPGESGNSEPTEPEGSNEV